MKEKNKLMDNLLIHLRRSQLQPPDPFSLGILGTEYFRLGRYDQAGQFLNFSLHVNPRQPEISHLLNHALSHLGKTFYLQSKVGSFLCCDSQGNYLATGGSGKDPIIIWDFWKRSPLKTFPNPGGFIRAMSFSPCGRYLAVGGNDQNVRLGKIFEPETELQTLGAHDDFVISVAFSQDALFSAGQDGKVLKFLQKAKGEYERPILVLRNPLFYSMLVHSEGIYLAGYGIDRYSFETTPPKPKALEETKEALFFCLDIQQNTIVAGEGDASNATHIRSIWGFHHKKRWRFPAHYAMIKTVQIHPKHPLILSSSFEGKTKLFSLHSGREIASYPALVTGMSRFHPYADCFIHFRPDGHLEVISLPKIFSA